MIKLKLIALPISILLHHGHYYIEDIDKAAFPDYEVQQIIRMVKLVNNCFMKIGSDEFRHISDKKS